MPENSACNTASCGESLKKQQCAPIAISWFHLPYELWLSVLVDYRVSAADLVGLEYSAKWFSSGWGGQSNN